MLDLRLLGQVDLRGPEGQSLLSVLSQTKRFALLAYLAAESGQVHRRDTLLALFWPEHEDDRARKALNQAVYQLRRSLGDGVVLTVGDGDLALDPDRLRCDVRDFEQAREADTPANAAERYTGDLLPGFHVSDAPGFEDWLARRRQQLRADAAHSALAAAASARERAEAVGAARWARRSMELAPFDETLHRSALEVLEASGDHAGALRAYEAFAERLEEDFSARPSAETRRLIERIAYAVSPGASGGTQGVAVVRAGLGPSTMDASAPDAPEPGVGHSSQVGATVSEGRPDPLRRIVGLGLLLVVGVASVWGLSRPDAGPSPAAPVGALDPERVLVVPFENRTGDPELEGVGRLAADWITQELARSGLARVVPFISLAHLEGPGTWEDPQLMRASVIPLQVARDHDAGILVSGSVYRVDDEIVFQATVTDAGTGDVLRGVEPVSAPRDAVGEGVSRLRDEVVGAVVTLLDPNLRLWSDFASSPPDLETYRLYAEGITRFVDHQADAWTPLITAAEADSTFTAPLIWAYFAAGDDPARRRQAVDRIRDRRPRMAPWDRAMADYVVASHEADYLRAYEAGRRAANIAPNSEWEYKVARGACLAQLKELCAESLARLYPFERGWMASWARWGAGWGTYLDLMEELGDYQALLEGSERYLERFQDDPIGGHLYKMAALVHLDRTAEALAHVDSVVEVRAEEPWVGLLLASVGRWLSGHGHRREAVARLATSARWFEPRDRGLTREDRVVRMGALYWLHRLESDPEASRERLAEAADLAMALSEEFPDAPVVLRNAGVPLARSGHALGDSADARRARELETRLVAETSSEHLWRGPIGRARIAAARDDHEATLSLLEEGYRVGLPWSQVANWIDFEPLWSHPRFRMMWPHQHQALEEHAARYGSGG